MSQGFKSLMAKHLRLGRLGERAARRMLAAKGFETLLSNYRPAKGGEIDIVALDGGTLCFVEVKTRRWKAAAGAGWVRAPWLGRAQSERIVAAGRRYLREIGNPRVLVRFDLVEVSVSRFGLVEEARHWEGCFGKFTLDIGDYGGR